MITSASDDGRVFDAVGQQVGAALPTSTAGGDAMASTEVAEQMSGWLDVASGLVKQPSPLRIARGVYAPPTRLVGWIANTLGASMSRLGSGLSGDESDTDLPTAPFVIADRSMTRC
jgi:hypothetical protein